MGFLASLLAGFIPMFFYAVLIYWMDRFEKEPKRLLGVVFLWGALIAAVFAFLLNTLFGIGILLVTGSETAAEFTTGSLIAPMIEESLKGMAVLGVFLIFRPEFDSILDGIIYAAVTALGFAATENAYYIYSYGFLEQGWAGFLGMFIIRVIVVAWQHPFYTSFIGIGLAVTRLNRNRWIRISAPILGWGAAVGFHSVHNTIAGLGTDLFCVLGSLLDWSGWIAMFLFMLWMIYREKKMLINQLRPELDVGLINQKQYETACSSLKQMAARLKSINLGNYRSATLFFQLCGELAHKKNQLSLLGDEFGNTAIIDKLRKELGELSPQVNF
jgi:protease PrsW